MVFCRTSVYAIITLSVVMMATTSVFRRSMAVQRDVRHAVRFAIWLLLSVAIQTTAEIVYLLPLQKSRLSAAQQTAEVRRRIRDRFLPAVDGSFFVVALALYLAFFLSAAAMVAGDHWMTTLPLASGAFVNRFSCGVGRRSSWVRYSTLCSRGAGGGSLAFWVSRSRRV